MQRDIVPKCSQLIQEAARFRFNRHIRHGGALLPERGEQVRVYEQFLLL